jgi:hypothetical protein
MVEVVSKEVFMQLVKEAYEEGYYMFQDMYSLDIDLKRDWLESETRQKMFDILTASPQIMDLGPK